MNTYPFGEAFNFADHLRRALPGIHGQYRPHMPNRPPQASWLEVNTGNGWQRIPMTEVPQR